MADKDTGKKFDPNFYTLPPWPIVISSPILQYFFLMSTFAPNHYPAFLGSVGEYARDLGLNHPTFFLGLIIVIYGAHVVETIIAIRLCRELQMTESASIKWIVTVAAVGIFSLTKLRSLRKLKAA